MDRRSFLRTTGLAAGAAAATGLATPSVAQGREQLVMVTTWPRGLAGVWDAAERFSANVADASDGMLTIDVKAAGELVGPLESFDAVASGQADVYHGADYYWVSVDPTLALFTAVPLGMTVPELMTWYYAEDGMSLHHELGEIYGLRSFIAGQTGAQGGGWFRNPIESAEDFKGLKFRMPGLGGQVLSTLGASVQNIPGGEIYQALSSGALDGTEWIGPWSDERLGLQEVCDYYYPAGFHEPGAALSVAVNLDRWAGLSTTHQRVIEIAAADAHQANYAQFIANNGPALQRLIAGGTQLRTFSDDVWDGFAQGATQVLEEYRSDPLFAKVHDSFLASAKATSAWIGRSDAVYAAQRLRTLQF